MKPLVKWAGGKRQIISTIMQHLPSSWKRYYEPFAGGVALLVELHNSGRLGTSRISDTNPELINLYVTVKNRPEELISIIEHYGFRNEDSFYYSCRAKYNTMVGDEESSIERAALFLYLNRHGYNGLWRVNSTGRFNVPFGRYSKASLPSAEHIKRFSQFLKTVEIRLEDFESSVNDADEGDFVYFDPPYLPVSDTARFTDYTKEGFEYSDQVRLLKVCRRLDGRGVNFLLSNSFTQETEELYSEFNSFRITARRSINSKSEGRSGHLEVMISNFPSWAAR